MKGNDPEETMPLVSKCKEYIGRKLVVVPYYGNGWTRPHLDVPESSEDLSIGPSPFHIRLEELTFCSGQTMGGSGKIVEPEHQLNGYWCGFYLRMSDDHDFSDRPGDYMIWISMSALQVDPAPQKALYEWVSFTKDTPCLCGYGMVAETTDQMKRFYELVMETRKNLLGDSVERISL